MENGGGIQHKISAEDVISKLKNDGDFDRLRLKIIRKLKENVSAFYLIWLIDFFFFPILILFSRVLSLDWLFLPCNWSFLIEFVFFVEALNISMH